MAGGGSRGLRRARDRLLHPGLGPLDDARLADRRPHLAERCQQFIIIALGESILDTGATFGERGITATTAAAFVVAFLGNVALWWIYFDRAAEVSTRAIAATSDPGRLGRSTFTYFHLPMVAGIIVAAVAIERAIAHPTAAASAATTAVVLGGPALFLAGHALFKWAVFGRVSGARLLALGALALLIPVGLVVPPLALGAATAVVVAAVAWWGSREAHPASSAPPAPTM